MKKVEFNTNIKIASHQNCVGCNELHIEDILSAIGIFVILIIIKKYLSNKKQKNRAGSK
jgi:hypothetical protein